MAKIKVFTRENGAHKMTRSVTETECLYSVGTDAGGKNYVVLRTTGTGGHSVSQTLHIDTEAAQELIAIFRENLGL
ncbi:hypothetical protein LJC32_05025 [Oscillospiraceae bacterium OttesenSCG-928-F05]|nr:hypothetical protein [Oscillospiraceae bacterium OttesenSCG-928-F05]